MTPRISAHHNCYPPQEERTSTLIRKAIRLARASHAVRTYVRDLLAELDRRVYIEQHGDPSIPPATFRAALRRPVGSKRQTITVLVDGKRVALLLNPQGRTDPEREQWLWQFIRTRVAQGA